MSGSCTEGQVAGKRAGASIEEYLWDRRPRRFCSMPSTFAALILAAFCATVATPTVEAQKTAPKTETSSKKTSEPMRLTTHSDHARESFGQAVLFSGNYRLDQCLKSLRTATTEDANFAAGWALLSYYATDARESADALAHGQS